MGNPIMMPFSSYFIKQVRVKDTGRSCLGVSELEWWVMLDTEINSKCLDLLRPHPMHPTPSSPPPIIPSFSIFLYVGDCLVSDCVPSGLSFHGLP